MNKEWVAKKEFERKERVKSLTSTIKETILSMGDYTDEEKQMFIDRFYEMKNLRMYGTHMLMPHIRGKFKYNDRLYIKTQNILDSLPYDELLTLEGHNYTTFLDSDKKHFCGDIIITDPCYIAKDDDWPDFLDVVYKGENEIKTFIERDTIYGDWSCTVFDTINKEKIGTFCADAGFVGVFDLNEVITYNPSFDYHTERPWTTTLIKDFDGDIWFEVKEEYDEKYGNDYLVEVVGAGRNIKTGERLEFRSTQTGL